MLLLSNFDVSEKIGKAVIKYSLLTSSFCLFCNLIALTLGSNSVESLRLTKTVKEIKFKGVWDELGSRKVSRDNQLQNI